MGSDPDTMMDVIVDFYLPATKSIVIEAILKQHPTWERRGSRIYNGVGQIVKLEWETINQ